MTYHKPMTGSVPLCPLMFSCHTIISTSLERKSVGDASQKSLCFCLDFFKEHFFYVKGLSVNQRVSMGTKILRGMLAKVEF